MSAATPDGTTRHELIHGSAIRVALVGDGIGPSLTPALHEREGAGLGLDYVYERVDLAEEDQADLGAVLDGLEARGVVAANITHPYKQRVLEHVHVAGEEVVQIGSANLVLLGPCREAHNTDHSAFRAGLESFLGDDARGRALQIGAGGAGLATVHALASMGFAEIVVHDLDAVAARRVVERFRPHHPGTRFSTTGGDLEATLGRVDGVVHATPTGMAAHPGAAVAPEDLPAGAWISEVVYRPLETELVARARACGLRVLDGGLMAVGQAADSIRHITGLEPDRDRMRRQFEQLVTDESGTR